MKKYLTTIGFIIGPIMSYVQDNISQGINDSIYSKKYTKVYKYGSQVNYPPFIGWILDSKKMLFNGGKTIY